jgi:hypothetical protein
VLESAAAAGMNRAAAEEEYGVVSKLRKTSPTARAVNSEPWIQRGRAVRCERSYLYRVPAKTFLASASKRGSPRNESSNGSTLMNAISYPSPILVSFFEQLQRFVFLAESDMDQGEIVWRNVTLLR